MAIDTQTKRRSVHGYGIGTIAPLADGTIGSADREHMAWLYAGIAATAPPAAELPFISDAYTYDDSGGTGSITGGTVLSGDAIYDEASATGTVGSGTTQDADTIYD